MNRLGIHVRAALWWLLPLAGLAAVIGWETDWGRAVGKRPPPAEAIAPKPVVASLLPEFTIAGGVAARTETVAAHALQSDPPPGAGGCRRLAPTRLQRGQFALTGTMLVDGKSTAFLREVAGNKARRVQAGEKINGMLVAEVRPDRVRLDAGRRIRGAGAQGRHQPASDRAAGRRRAGGDRRPRAWRRAADGAAAARGRRGRRGATDAAQTLAERRRAARAAAARRRRLPAACRRRRCRPDRVPRPGGTRRCRRSPLGADGPEVSRARRRAQSRRHPMTSGDNRCPARSGMAMEPTMTKTTRCRLGRSPWSPPSSLPRVRRRRTMPRAPAYRPSAHRRCGPVPADLARARGRGPARAGAGPADAPRTRRASTRERACS